MRSKNWRAALMMSVALIATAPAAWHAYATPVETAAAVGSFAPIAERAIPAVVTVRVEIGSTAPDKRAGANEPEDFKDRFFGQVPPGPNGRDEGRNEERGGPRVGLGSGFIIEADGLIVTNNHVVGEGGRIIVTLSTGEEFPAELVGADPRTDLAVIRVDAGRELPTIAWGDSDAIRVGDWAVAIGNPFGLGGTVTAGIVSARGRDIHSGPYDDFLQVDTAINQGNSGGPLLDLSGDVIGVNTAIFSPTGGNVGVGFAIPSNQARAIVAALAENGVVERGWLGVSIQPVTPDIAEALGLDSAQGALVAEVVQGSPAAAAGFEAGDVVLALDGEALGSVRELPSRVADIAPGTEVTATVWRDGAEKEITVEIGRMEPERRAEAAPAPVEEAGDLGLALAPAEDGLAVTGVDPDGPAAASGLRPGDVIVSAGDEPMRAPADFAASVDAARDAGQHAILLLMERDGMRRFVAVPVDGA